MRLPPVVDSQAPPSKAALALTKRLQTHVLANAPRDQPYLQLGPSAIQLCQPTRPATCIKVDFVSGRQAHRRRQLGHQREAIARACGLGQAGNLHIVDATAGLGRDAFVLAALGAQVTLIERSPVLCAMLEDGLERARAAGLEPARERMRLIEAEACVWLDDWRNQSPIDVVYLDPMYSGSRRAAAGKELALLAALLGPSEASTNLLATALTAARKRVVVKRQRRAPALTGRPPDHQLVGKSTRFDVYQINPAQTVDSAEY